MYRVNWTDDRLQERFDSIDRRFDEVDKRFDKVEGELKWLGAKMDTKFDGLQRTLMLTGGGIIATLIAGIVSVVATQL